MPTVKAAHFVARNFKNVVRLEGGFVWSGRWKVAKHHWPTIRFVALHQDKGSKSYLQGDVVDHRESRAEPGRVEFKVKLSATPVDWVGDGSGEKGYVWK